MLLQYWIRLTGKFNAMVENMFQMLACIWTFILSTDNFVFVQCLPNFSDSAKQYCLSEVCDNHCFPELEDSYPLLTCFHRNFVSKLVFSKVCNPKNPTSLDDNNPCKKFSAVDVKMSSIEGISTSIGHGFLAGKKQKYIEEIRC